MSDKELLEQTLESLRASNAEKWEHLTRLHSTLYEETASDEGSHGSTPKPSAASISLHAVILAELDVLPRNEMLCESTRMLEQIGKGDEDDGIEFERAKPHQDYSKELVHSFQDLSQVNVILDKVIYQQMTKLDRVKSFAADHEEIQQHINYFKASRQCVNKVSAESLSIGTAMEVDQDSGKIMNQLREDLTYVSGLVARDYRNSSQLRSTSGNPQVSDQGLWTLERTIWELCQQASVFPDDPYLATDQMDPEHVCLLQRWFLIESFTDDDKAVRLVEY